MKKLKEAKVESFSVTKDLAEKLNKYLDKGHVVVDRFGVSIPSASRFAIEDNIIYLQRNIYVKERYYKQDLESFKVCKVFEKI